MGILGAVTKPVGSAMGLISLTTDGLLRSVASDSWRTTPLRAAQPVAILQWSIAPCARIAQAHHHGDDDDDSAASQIVFKVSAAMTFAIMQCDTSQWHSTTPPPSHVWQSEQLSTAAAIIGACTLLVSPTAIALIGSSSQMLLIINDMHAFDVRTINNSNSNDECVSPSQEAFEIRTPQCGSLYLTMSSDSERCIALTTLRYYQHACQSAHQSAL
jgi:hypothetical protein